MITLDDSTGALHFIGIGGIGMSGLAELCHRRGYCVRGSDRSADTNVNAQRLAALGIQIWTGHSSDHLEGAGVVIVSSAVQWDNPELVGARRRNLPVLHRAQLLAELMRGRRNVVITGTHGKTTTTSLIGDVCVAGGLDPTVVNGGIMQAHQSNVRVGDGQWMVVEADESDGSMVNLPADVAVITNIDPEHLDFYGDFQAIRRGFREFVGRLSAGGALIGCSDHPEVAQLANQTAVQWLGYGFSPDATVQGTNLHIDSNGTTFDVLASLGYPRYDGIFVPMPGVHQALNALATVAVGRYLRLPAKKIAQALKDFGGVRRRFTTTGHWQGVRIIDDYAHHPVEIAAVISAARHCLVGGEGRDGGRLIVVWQPHRYSRLRDLWDDFWPHLSDAEAVVVADVYAAGEEPIAGIDQTSIIEALRHHNLEHHRTQEVIPLAHPADLAELVAQRAQPGDIVLCLGAGSVTSWAQDLPGRLAALYPEPS